MSFQKTPSDFSSKIVFGFIGFIVIFSVFVFIFTYNKKPDTSSTKSNPSAIVVPAGSGIPKTQISTPTPTPTTPTAAQQEYEDSGLQKYEGYRRDTIIRSTITNDPRDNIARNLTEYNYLKLVQPGTESDDNSPTTDFIVTWDTKIYIDDKVIDQSEAEKNITYATVSSTIVYYSEYTPTNQAPVNIAAAIFASNVSPSSNQ